MTDFRPFLAAILLGGEPQLSGMRRHSREMGETSNIERFQTTVDLWLAEAESPTGVLKVRVPEGRTVSAHDNRSASRSTTSG